MRSQPPARSLLLRRSRARRPSFWLTAGLAVGSLLATALQPPLPTRAPSSKRLEAHPEAGNSIASSPNAERDGTCVTCHTGIEEIHPGFSLSCVDCHGGDDTKSDKRLAHVLPTLPEPTDERVVSRTYDLPFRRFKNPSDLRVAEQVCGDCHGELLEHLEKSLHGTTAGHLGDGFYEHGIESGKRPRYSIFPVRDEDGKRGPHALAKTEQVPGFRRTGAKDRIETHYSDLPRKACMHCHLYSEGRAIDGRVGMDGDYRGEGCAACHVTYAEDGRSRSADPTVPKFEPGHPLKHRFTNKIPTATCTRCHYGDASIGMHFRGLAQLVPGMPAGPEVPGTTDQLQNGTFYIKDPDLTPPDLHHERGMHCIDCHTLADTMGDGDIYPQMDHAVEIECTSCHGTLEQPTDLTTSHGRRVPNLERKGGQVFLRSKVTGRLHPVMQAAHVIDPEHEDYNPRAAAAMTGDHARLECYTCHSGWNVSFFGFHFDRNEQFTQLDLLSGQRTPGRVTTQEKVFATFNQLRLGFNHEDKIAPYMVGFSTIGSAHDANGDPLLRQALPTTKTGLSGVTLIPHQVHSVRSTARTCVECHRSPATLGLGSTNFRLTRELGYGVGARAFHTIALDAKTPSQSGVIHRMELPFEARSLAIRSEPESARATHAYVAGRDGTLAVIALRNPGQPRIVQQKARLADPRRLLVQGDQLIVADGVGGVSLFDIRKPAKPKLQGVLPTTDARSVHLAWPWLLVADGAGGLLIADVTDPERPRVLSSVDLNGEAGEPNEALDLAVLFRYSRTSARTRRSNERGRPDTTRVSRDRARHLAFVACGLDGVRIVDFTEPTAPRLLGGRRNGMRFNRGDVRGIAVNTVFDLGSPGGGIKSQERDYLYVYANEGTDDNRQQRVYSFDVSDPTRPRRVRKGAARVYGGTGRLLVARTYNAPFLKHFVVAAGAGGLGTLVDVSKLSSGAEVAAVWDDVRGLRDLAVEEFAFDRLQNERAQAEKDISHEGCRYLTRDEMLRVLQAPLPTSVTGAPASGRYGEEQAPKRRRRPNK